jgi:hypothetical protein
MKWPRLWRDRSWEDRAWHALLLWNLAALVYLVVRTPSADATWVFRVTFWADVAAIVWWVGRTVQILVTRRRPETASRPDEHA